MVDDKLVLKVDKCFYNTVVVLLLVLPSPYLKNLRVLVIFNLIYIPL